MVKFRRLLLSFKYAFKGLNKVFWEEQNFRVHITLAIVALLLALFYRIEVWQFIILIIIIALVLTLEIINSIVERLIDLLKPRIHQYVKDIKDMTAAAVFIGALTAVIVGLLIFLPYMLAGLFKLIF